MSRVVFITQQFDPEDPLLGSVVAQVAALARRVDEVVVVVDGIVASALPSNARARSFRSRTQLGRGLKLFLAIARELPGLRRNGAVVAHMVPLYAIIAAPLLRPARVPLLMWWSHWKIDGVVRLAERVCTTIVTVGDTTFPMASKKVVTVGQAIDVASIPERNKITTAGQPLRVVVVGRYSPAKGVGTIIRAVRLAIDRGADLRLEIYGPALTAEARTEQASLQQLVAELELTDRARLGGSLTRSEVLALLAEADLLVNNAPGGADRIVYEAGAAELPVLASNPANANVLEPDAFYHRDDAEELAAKIVALAALSPAQRDQIGHAIRARVIAGNSVDSWADGLLRAAGIRSPD